MNITNLKLNVLLGKTDALAPSFKGHLKDYFNFFKTSQGAFHGEKKTYVARPDTEDKPNLRVVKKVQTTVDEKLDYFVKHQAEYIDCVMCQEATNASGMAKAMLQVEGVDWCELSSLELLKLKSILELQEFRLMHENIVVRSDSQEWEKTDNADYVDRKMWETPLLSWVEKTVEKDSYILNDPNIQYLKDAGAYKPQVAQKNTTKELGDATRQEFSGEWSQKEKADVLDKINTLKVAIVVALKQCNETQVIQSNMTAERLFSYLYKISSL